MCLYGANQECIHCFVDLRYLWTTWHHFGIIAGSMHHIEPCYQQSEKYQSNLQTEKTTVLLAEALEPEDQDELEYLQLNCISDNHVQSQKLSHVCIQEMKT